MVSKKYLLTEQYTVLTMVCNIQIQYSSLGPCPSSNTYLKKTLKHYVSETGFASVFKQETHFLLK